MISLCARPNTDRTHGLVSRCNKGFEVTALSSTATTGYCKSAPLVEALKTNSVREEVKEFENIETTNTLLITKVIFSFVILYFSSKYFIGYARNISTYFGIADTIIGVSIVALGTSLPEVITTIIAIYKKRSNLALGNIIGSCVANITMISFIAILIGGSINFYELLDTFNKLIFLLTGLVFYSVIIGKFANKITAIIFLVLYVVYILMLYI